MSDNQAFEVDLTDEEIEQASDKGDELFCNLMNVLTDGDEDAAGVMYSLWANLTIALARCGWTTDDLINDVKQHIANNVTTRLH